MGKEIDVRNQMPGGNSKSNIKEFIARHHSGTTGGDVFAFLRHWIHVLRWFTGGYHYVILPNGDYQRCYDDNVITNGVGNHNTRTIHICLVGNGKFTAAQEATWNKLVKELKKKHNIPVSRVLGHNEFAGHRSNFCPGINMNMVRNILEGIKATIAPSATKEYPKLQRMLQLDSPFMRGKDVEEIQKAVGAKQDGVYGPKTEELVIAFQQQEGLAADGIVGPLTWEAINEGRTLKTVPSKSAQSTPATGRWATIQSTLNSRYNTGLAVDNTPGPLTKRGIVRGVQSELNSQTNARLTVDGIVGPKTRAAFINVRSGSRGNLTWLLQAALLFNGFDPGVVDGVNGTNTQSALKRFQRAHGLTPDGIAGAQTWSVLLR
ncbi:N-acetylmuramoyl-L-alanine amidase [Alkalihalophilus marmarensis]|uniref:peptidoglycan recognition protein family protein n=1 Tax=Alkalihalophilus marmarensis TaxID=521377 RepID=UPI002E227A89|nr:peptidoglycan-binding protein [Alkalihalophilus marmarensis]